MPYIMTAPQYLDYAFTIARVGTFDTFRDFLAAYPKMKAFYGDALECAYTSSREAQEYDDADDWGD